MARRKNSSRRTRQGRPGGAPEASGWRGAWDRLSERTQHLICLVVLVAVSIGFFAPVHFSGKSIVGGDTVNWRAMAQSMVEYTRDTGEQALWAPNAFGGMPGFMINYADQVPQLDDIPQFLRTFLWPSSHLILLLVGTYLFVFFLTRDKLSSVLAACAYGLTTYLPVILMAGHNTKFVALSFAPWLALAFAYALRRPKLLSSLLFAAALAANLRAGHVQITYYVTFLLGFWWVVEAVSAFRHGRGRAFGKATGYLVLGSVLGLAMVAQPYLINAEYKEYTIRGASTAAEGGGGLDWSYAMSWSQGAGELVTLAVANAYGGEGGTYWGPKPFTGGPHYVGGIVLLLAGLALWRLRRRVVWAFGGGALLMVLFALGEHFALLNRPMYAYFPLFDAFRVPETWLSVVAFALAVLAGFGLYDAAQRASSAAEGQRRTKVIYVATGTALGVVLLLLVMRGVFFDFQKPQEEEQLVQMVVQQRPDLSAEDPRVQQAIRQEIEQREEARAELFTADAWRTLIFLLLAGGVLVLYRRGTLPVWAMQAALVLLVVIDLGGVGRRYLDEEALVQSRSVTAQIPEYGFDRYIMEQVEEAGGPGHFRVLSLESGDPMTNARPSYYYESLGGYHGAKLRRYQDYIDHMLRAPEAGGLSDNALDLLSTRYVVAQGQLPGMEAVYRDEETGMAVLENPDAVPRAFFVGATEVVESTEDMWQRLRSEDFDPRRTALLPEPIDFETTQLDSGSTASVELERFTPREIVWQVETDAPRLMVASEVYYPAGWNAYLDGEQVPIYRANYLLRAVPVPEGKHRLVMRFEPPGHVRGVWISAVSTVLVYGGTLMLLGLAFVRRRQRTEGEPIEDDVHN